MDLHVFDYSEPGNFSDISWPCNSSDCIVVDTLQCSGLPNKSVLLYTLAFVYIFIFVIGMIANSVVVWVNIQAKTTGYDTLLHPEPGHRRPVGGGHHPGLGGQPRAA